jgi:phage gp36-like protein
MSYCAKADLQKEISDDELIGLTDDESAGTINDARITAAIARADAIIDSYCGQIETVPFITVPGVIKQHSITIAIYFLFTRRSAVPEIRRKNYEDAIAHLKDIAAGKATIGATIEADYEDKAEMSAGNRIFTRDKLKGF